MKLLYCCLLVLITGNISAQPLSYTVANAHSHNDYENAVPFRTAYNAGFGSIEVDIFLHKKKLLVAHEEKGLVNNISLEDLYLKPIQSSIEKQRGYIYADTAKQLQLLIDIKTDSVATPKQLIKVLKKYPALINNRSLKLVITGNRPLPENFSTYPSYIFFDGNIGTNYSKTALAKIAMLSSSFQNYSKWNGAGMLTEKEKAQLTAEIEKAHALHKPVRFWAAPDTINAWKQFIDLRVDFINTDKITELAAFLQQFPAPR